MTKQIIYVIGSLGTYPDEYIKTNILNKYPDNYQYIDFIKILLEQKTFVPYQPINSLPKGYVNISYYNTIRRSCHLIIDALIKDESIIIGGSGTNTEGIIDNFNLWKKMGYKIVIYYLDQSLQQDLSIINIVNKTSVLPILEGDALNVFNLLEQTIHLYKDVADKFYHIKL